MIINFTEIGWNFEFQTWIKNSGALFVSFCCKSPFFERGWLIKIWEPINSNSVFYFHKSKILSNSKCIWSNLQDLRRYVEYSKTSQMTTSKVTNLAKWLLAFRELDLAKMPKWPKDLANDDFWKWPVPKLVICEVLL